jgi:hypothetical protein
MASKSKRNRRNISPNGDNNNASVETASTPVAQSTTSKSEPVASAYKGSSRSTPQELIYPSFTRDLKWIALVAAIVVILLIVAYYMFR